MQFKGENVWGEKASLLIIDLWRTRPFSVSETNQSSSNPECKGEAVLGTVHILLLNQSIVSADELCSASPASYHSKLL